ncbi:MAG: Smr/MutS family protein [Gemmatimonadaceae bacterium]
MAIRRRPAVQRAFDEVRFGATRILNVRDALLTGAEAVRRVEGWIRAKQVEHADEVLVITGRGNQSVGQIAVVREEVRKLLNRLRRAGVVSAINEHTPGSFAVSLAPLRAMFDAPPRSRDGHAGRQRHPPRNNPQALAGLGEETLALLRRVAMHSLDSLGMPDPDEPFIQGEMERKFSLLARALGTAPSEAALRTAIARALAEYEDAD